MSLDAAIVGALRGDTELTGMLPDAEYGIGHGGVPSGTSRPYILVYDVSEVPQYAFGNVEKMSDAVYRIIVYTEDTDDKSAQEVDAEIQERLLELLHNEELIVAGRTMQVMQRGSRLTSGWEYVSDQERYYRNGYRWHVTTVPA